MSLTAQVPPKIDDMVNAQVNISKLTDRQRNIYEVINVARVMSK